MKKIIFISVCTLIASNAFSIQNSGATHKKSSSATLSDEKVKMLCKGNWKLDSVEEFGVTHIAKAKQKTDNVTFSTDGTFSITMEGIFAKGSWKYVGNDYISATASNPSYTKKYKLLGLMDGKFVMEYQTPDLIRIHYIYSVK